MSKSSSLKKLAPILVIESIAILYLISRCFVGMADIELTAKAFLTPTGIDDILKFTGF